MHVNQNIYLQVSFEYYKQICHSTRAVWELVMHSFKNINVLILLFNKLLNICVCVWHLLKMNMSVLKEKV